MSYKKAVLVLIIVGVVLRCLIGASIEFGNDEVYYWTYSQHLQWNYFDHPPMVALMVRLTTLNLNLQQFELFVRLGSIICCAFATYFLYKTVSNLDTERAGFFAAVFYNASFYGSIITGVFILPDSPQMFFWTVSLLVLSQMVRSEKPKSYQWIVFGIVVGLTIMSKIHGIFLWTGLLLYIIFLRRNWLRSWPVYVSAALTLVIVLPFIFWNFKNNFITYRFHSSRLEGIHFKGDNFGREIFGEIFYNNPIVVFLTFAALFWFLRKMKETRNDFLRVSTLISIPMILLLLVLSMFNDTLPHWTGSAYITLIPLTSIYVSRTRIAKKIPGVVRSALIFTLLIVAAGVLVINFYPGTLGKRKANTSFGEGDVTLDMYGWKQVAKKIDSLVVAEEKNGLMDKNAQFISNEWFPAAHIDYYIARPVQKFVIGIGEMNDLHHYEWLNEYRLNDRSLKNAYCVFPSNYACDVKTVFSDKFESIDSVAAFPILRNNKICRYFFIYRMKNFVGVVPKVK